MKRIINSILLVSAALVAPIALPACSDDDKTEVREQYGFEKLPESSDLGFGYEAGNQVIEFTALGLWHVELEAGVDWVYFSPQNGKKGKNTVKVSVSQNTADTGRAAVFNLVSGDKKETFTVRQPEFGGTLPGLGESKKTTIDPSEIPDYDKFFKNSEHGGGILKTASKFSFARYKSSEHFFVFWAPEFGDDPNASTVPASMRVDIDDLLAKAEHFFDTNVNKLGMATLGQGMSMLDDYKMQIYLLYQDEWLATGSGYDNAIGALWVNPSTCQPVGSTIAHEIGHSFQYQTYADRVQRQGVYDDYSSGFRYGFSGPDNAHGDGCVYWEQCAQWQAQRDYPQEQFTSYNFGEWLKNCHRHFHHEWQRYASYWLQSYWVEKHGVEAYGRIWKESVAPEDAIMAYTRLYNGGDYARTREELFDYAMRMATYDIKDVREYANGYQGLYDTKLNLIAPTGEYQVAYASCPGATGFNVIELEVPQTGKVSVNFRGLEYGAALHSKDKGLQVDGDGNIAGETQNYNAVGAASNMGWRYGFVALAGEKRTYSTVGNAKEGSLAFDVPAGTEKLFFVVQGSPETYMSHAWDEVEKNDPQFPYAFKLEGTNLLNYKEEAEPVFKVVDNANMEVSLTMPLKAPGDYNTGSFDLASKEICDFLGLDRNGIAEKIKVAEAPAEGIISCRALNTDGTYNTNATANNGFWLNAQGDEGEWNGGYVFFEVAGSALNFGAHPGQIVDGYTGSHTMRPVLVYTDSGKTKTIKITITLNYK